MPGLAAACCVVYVIFAERLVGREDLAEAEQLLRAQADADDGVCPGIHRTPLMPGASAVSWVPERLYEPVL